MKDVSKHTLDNLISFIYYGEVNVQQEHEADFMNAAIALNIKCLAERFVARIRTNSKGNENLFYDAAYLL